jgi:lipoprotein-releasing system permease protein
MFKSFEFKIAGRYLSAQRKSFFVSLISLFSLLGVAIGTFALVVVLSAMNGFEEEVTSQMIGKDAHFEVMAATRSSLTITDTATKIFDKTPDILAYSPYVLSKAGISSQYADDGIVVYGIDDAKAARVLQLPKNIKYGRYTTASFPDSTGKIFPSILLGSALAARLEVSIGDKIILQTFIKPEDGGLSAGPKMTAFRVSAIFESGMYEYDANLAYIGLEPAMNLLSSPGMISGWQMKIKNPFEVKNITKALAQKLGETYYLLDWEDKNATLLKWMKLEKMLFGGAVFLIVLIAAFNIISSLIMVVLEKTREIGIMRAMGASKNSILRIFVMVGGVIGISGTIVGVGSGLLLCWAQSTWGIVKLPPDVYMISVFPIQVHFQDIVMIASASIITSLLVTLPPAFKASRLKPVDAIRHE